MTGIPGIQEGSLATIPTIPTSVALREIQLFGLWKGVPKLSLLRKILVGRKAVQVLRIPRPCNDTKDYPMVRPSRRRERVMEGR